MSEKTEAVRNLLPEEKEHLIEFLKKTFAKDIENITQCKWYSIAVIEHPDIPGAFKVDMVINTPFYFPFHHIGPEE